MLSRLHHRKAQKDLFKQPEIIEVENLIQDVKAVAFAAKHDLLLIDTPAVIDDTAIVESAVAVSNVTCWPSVLDIATMDAQRLISTHAAPVIRAAIIPNLTSCRRGASTRQRDAGRFVQSDSPPRLTRPVRASPNFYI